MKLHISAPRLLPLTIAIMAALLAVKSISLVRAGVPAPVAAEMMAPPPATPSATAAPAQPMANVANPAQNPPAPVPAAVAVSPPAEPPVSDTERSLLLDLRHRRAELDAREVALASREAVLAAAEKRLAARVDELTALQGKLEALAAARKERDDANWDGLVKLYENMKPRDAATIFNDLDMPVLLQVLDRMKEAKAAPILAAMQPERARQVTAQLAELRRRANAVPASGKPAG